MLLAFIAAEMACYNYGIAGRFTSTQSTIFDKLGSLTWGGLLAALGLVKLV